MTKVDELKAALIGELEDSGESGIGEAEAKLDAFAAAVTEQQLKEDLAAVKRIPQYMVAVIDGWLEGSAPSPQGKMLQNIAKASAKFVEELIPDLFPTVKP